MLDLNNKMVELYLYLIEPGILQASFQPLVAVSDR